jgi:hypothetical protein
METTLFSYYDETVQALGIKKGAARGESQQL